MMPIPQVQNCMLFVDLSAEDRARIEQIYVRNLESGRAQRVIARLWSQQNELATSAEFSLANLRASEIEHWRRCYLQQVIQIYRQEHNRIDALYRGEREAWQTLAAQLNNSATRLLLQKGIAAAQAIELARDMAQQTCMKIYSSPFPYDVGFMLWSHVILKNQILYILTRSGDLLDRNRHVDSLDRLQDENEDHCQWVAANYTATDPKSASLLNPGQVEEWDYIARALEKLTSPGRRAVIILTYFYELSDEEIASQLGKSKNAIYTLRHRALRQLQQVLSDALED